MSAQGSSGLFLGFAKIQECGGLYSWYQKMPRSSAERQLRVALLAGDVAFPSGPTAVGFSFLREGLQHYAGRLPCFWDTECLDKADAALTICSALPCSPRSSAICKGLIKAKQTFNKLLPQAVYRWDLGIQHCPLTCWGSCIMPRSCWHQSCTLQ